MFKKVISSILSLLLVGCATVPTTMRDVRFADYTEKCPHKIFNPMDTNIGKIYANELRDKNITGASLIEDGLSAFVIRAAFARMATKTIDLQTYIYSNDFTSRLLVQELRNAADRGVKVRILIDDYGVKSDGYDVMALNQHPNIEVRIFNVAPNRAKILYYPQFLTDFNRLNSRMHNKLFIVDDFAYITGGRNIGSNYFYPETASNFSDTDVLFIGAMTRDAEKSFNEYWSYHRSIPVSAFSDCARMYDTPKMTESDATEYDRLIRTVQNDYIKHNFDFSWGRGRLITDKPDKIDMSISDKENYRGEIIPELEKLWGGAKNSIYVSASYFAPGQNWVDKMIESEKSGVHLTLVTNSLASTNAPTVYTKWEKYRKQLLDAGADIYEFTISAQNRQGKLHDRERKQSSFSVLHSKTMVFDDKISWIGSFNMDPRSVFYNTENVAIFESAEFAKKLRDMIIDDARVSWHVELRDGHIIWVSPDGKIYNRSPDTTIFRRLFKDICDIVPEKFV